MHSADPEVTGEINNINCDMCCRYFFLNAASVTSCLILVAWRNVFCGWWQMEFQFPLPCSWFLPYRCLVSFYFIPFLFRITLNTLTLNVKSDKVYTRHGVPISVTGIAQVCLEKWVTEIQTMLSHHEIESKKLCMLPHKTRRFYIDNKYVVCDHF